MLARRFRDPWDEQDIQKFHAASRSKFLEQAPQRHLDTLRGLRFEVLEAYEHGNLNPSLVHLAIEKPRYLLEVYEDNDPATRELVENLTWELSQIRAVADYYGTKVHVISVPAGIYVDERAYRSREWLGFVLDPTMLTSDGADDPIRRAAIDSAVAFDQVTDTIREIARDESLFFDLDGHFNEAGHRHYAESIQPVLERHIQSSPDLEP